MDRYCPSWSRTQRDLFFKCPTAWVMRYAQPRRSGRTTIPAPASDWNLMLRALKSTIVDRLEALRLGTEWSESIASFALKEHLRGGFRAQKRAISPVKCEALLLFAEHRMKLLWRTDTFLRINKGTIRQWTLLNRRESEHIDGYDLFASPDLAYRCGGTWHLVRLDMQGSKMSDSERLESLAMVLWAMKRDGLPKVKEQFHIHTIGWRKGSWVVHSFGADSEEIDAARSLVSSDVSAMKQCAEVSRFALDCVPLAVHESTCTTCPFKARCLDGRSLAFTKKQRLRMLEQGD